MSFELPDDPTAPIVFDDDGGEEGRRRPRGRQVPMQGYVYEKYAVAVLPFWEQEPPLAPETSQIQGPTASEVPPPPTIASVMAAATDTTPTAADAENTAEAMTDDVQDGTTAVKRGKGRPRKSTAEVDVDVLPHPVSSGGKRNTATATDGHSKRHQRGKHLVCDDNDSHRPTSDEEIREMYAQDEENEVDIELKRAVENSDEDMDAAPSRPSTQRRDPYGRVNRRTDGVALSTHKPKHPGYRTESEVRTSTSAHRHRGPVPREAYTDEEEEANAAAEAAAEAAAAKGLKSSKRGAHMSSSAREPPSRGRRASTKSSTLPVNGRARPRKVQPETNKKVTGKRGRNRLTSEESGADSDVEVELVTPPASSRRKSRTKAIVDEDMDDEDPLLLLPTPVKKRGHPPKRPRTEEHAESSPRQSGKGKSKKSMESIEEPEAPINISVLRMRAARAARLAEEAAAAAAAEAAALAAWEAEEEEEDAEGEPDPAYMAISSQSPKITRSPRTTRAARGRRSRAEESEEEYRASSDEQNTEEEEEEEEEEETGPRKRKSRKNEVVDEEPEENTTRRRRSGRLSRRPSRFAAGAEEEELDEAQEEAEQQPLRRSTHNARKDDVEEEVRRSPRKNRRVSYARIEDEEDEEPVEEVPVLRRSTRSTRQSYVEVDEDDEVEIVSSAPPIRTTRSTRASAVEEPEIENTPPPRRSARVSMGKPAVDDNSPRIPRTRSASKMEAQQHTPRSTHRQAKKEQDKVYETEEHSPLRRVTRSGASAPQPAESYEIAPPTTRRTRHSNAADTEKAASAPELPEGFKFLDSIYIDEKPLQLSTATTQSKRTSTSAATKQSPSKAKSKRPVKSEAPVSSKKTSTPRVTRGKQAAVEAAAKRETIKQRMTERTGRGRETMTEDEASGKAGKAGKAEKAKDATPKCPSSKATQAKTPASSAKSAKSPKSKTKDAPFARKSAEKAKIGGKKLTGKPTTPRKKRATAQEAVTRKTAASQHRTRPKTASSPAELHEPATNMSSTMVQPVVSDDDTESEGEDGVIVNDDGTESEEEVQRASDDDDMSEGEDAVRASGDGIASEEEEVMRVYNADTEREGVTLVSDDDTESEGEGGDLGEKDVIGTDVISKSQAQHYLPDSNDELTYDDTTQPPIEKETSDRDDIGDDIQNDGAAQILSLLTPATGSD
ncbi:hypothetical protein DACRYDRAFT_89364 [Dacryopinax primogenitus]|uniref:Uncharacterized protein n=1 Tax=Dacryopinax primogenitus (strain DJM 731) TaxID=1858805 RepID=M5FYG9_DACPD|nr:uncharacterized protein DACRYDRAFT_89364 [Dacryopinax primogenitus]EJU00905.1 hypothetical protein DACRYDRAFT_89364 [Dacryopinax primogenitus]